jgi:hypothetical protein
MKNPGRTIAGIASATAVAVAVGLMVLGPFNLLGSRLPAGFYGMAASHWQAGQRRDCSLCPEKLFIVVCDADRQVHLRGLQQLAALRADRQIGGQAWSRAQGEAYPCIGSRGFRLGQPAGHYGAAYDEDDPGFRFDLSFKVIRDTAAGQVVEVRFRDSRTDIDDALFRYEAGKGTIEPLESWIVTRGHRVLALFGVLATLALVMLAWALHFATPALRRLLGSRWGGPPA